jgi:hypothetical protein
MADTASYYYAAYVVAGVLFVLYAWSLMVRRGRVARRMGEIERESGS